jgi:aminoglycoside phosphotransferase (APT) family kinase protein
MYRALGSRSFLAEVIQIIDGDQPELWLEDLAEAHWPPQWRAGDIERVQQTMADIHRIPPPPHLERRDPNAGDWAAIAAQPDAFLGLGWVDEAWLADALPVLTKAEQTPPDEPDGLLHADLRSDNLCLLPDRTLVIDWNHAHVGPIGHDMAFWACSLEVEGGPRPDDHVANGPFWSAATSGFFLRRAGMPFLEFAPRVRWIQQIQGRVALPWACRQLGLPRPWAEPPPIAAV